MHLRVAFLAASLALTLSSSSFGQGPSTGTMPPPPPPPPPPPTASGTAPPPPPPAPSQGAPAPAPQPATAPAPAANEVTVVARDGAMFHGTIVENVPQQYVTIRLSTGEYRRIAWSFIARIDGQVPTGPKVPVRLDADDTRAALQKYLGDGNWGRVCFAPCQGEVSADASYRVGGEGVVPSDPFRVPARGGRVTAKVGTKAKRITGAVLGVGGAGLFVIGSSLFTVGASGKVQENDGTTRPLTDTEKRNLELSGGISMGVGAVLGVVGLVMLLNSETEVTVGNAKAAPSLALGKSLRLGPSGFQF